MKLFAFIRYFLYLAWNWNPVLAIFMIRYEIRGEKKYGIHTTGFDQLKRLPKQGIDTTHSTIYMPANYYILEKLMEEIQHYPHNKSFLDIGCGKGRPMAVAAHFGFKKIMGVDIYPKFCEEARANLADVQQKFSDVEFRVILKNARHFSIPADSMVIFLFNPFTEVIVAEVAQHILESQVEHPRTIWIIYMNPMHENIFLEQGFVAVTRHRKLNTLEGCILEKGAEAGGRKSEIRGPSHG